MKRNILFLLGILLVCLSCKEEDYDAKTYYDAVGIGYIYVYDADGITKRPAQGAEIGVRTYLEGPTGLFGSNSFVDEIYTTNASGKYQIRFIKRTHQRDAKKYEITMLDYAGSGKRGFDLYVVDVKNKQTIVLDTIISL